MTLHYIFQDVPDNGVTTVHNLLGTLHRLHDTALDELADDKGLVELGSHQLGQTALAHLEFGTYHDNRTGAVVDTLTQQVLTEASLLTLERVGERLQGTVGIGLHGTALAAVVEEAVHGLLEHALLVAQNHLGSLYLDESFQTVVTDDDTTV